MINESKVQQFLQNLEYGKSDVEELVININDLCEQIVNVEQSMKELIGNYNYEKNQREKQAIMEGIQTLASYYKSDLNSINEELNKYLNLLSDIALSKINVPGYVDERELVLGEMKDFFSEFEYIFEQLDGKLQTFIDEPNMVNVETVLDMLGSEFDVEELGEKVKDNGNNMIDQLDEIRKNIETVIKKNTVRR